MSHEFIRQKKYYIQFQLLLCFMFGLMSYYYYYYYTVMKLYSIHTSCSVFYLQTQLKQIQVIQAKNAFCILQSLRIPDQMVKTACKLCLISKHFTSLFICNTDVLPPVASSQRYLAKTDFSLESVYCQLNKVLIYSGLIDPALDSPFKSCSSMLKREHA